jgi:hypothetical protein
VIGAILLQVDGLTGPQRAVRNHFQEGGSIGLVLLVMAAVAGVVLIAYWLTRRQQRSAQKHARINDPQRLFGDLLQGLALTASQRRLLATVVRELGLKHPSVILLSPTLFERHIDQWRALGRSTGSDVESHAGEDLVAQTRDVLFPP